MWIKFNYNTKKTTLSGYDVDHTQKFAIYVEKVNKALEVANILKNHPKVVDVKVMLEKPMDMYTVYLGRDARVINSTAQFLSNDDLRGFVWSLQVGFELAF